MVNGDTIAFEDTFATAVEVALGKRSATGLTLTGAQLEEPADAAQQVERESAADQQEQAEEPRAPVVLSDDAAELAQEAQDAFEEALELQRAGDWAGYGEAIERLGQILERLNETTE